MPYSFGTVVLVPFPFTDQTAIKRRPAVVVSSSDYQDARPDLVIMAITSQLRVSGEFDGLVVDGWRDAGLLKPSAVKPVFATIAEPLVIRSLGTLTGNAGKGAAGLDEPTSWLGRLVGSRRPRRGSRHPP